MLKRSLGNLADAWECDNEVHGRREHEQDLKFMMSRYGQLIDLEARTKLWNVRKEAPVK